MFKPFSFHLPWRICFRQEDEVCRFLQSCWHVAVSSGQNEFFFSPQPFENIFHYGENHHPLPFISLLPQDKLFLWQEGPLPVQRTKRRSLKYWGGSCSDSWSGNRENHHIVAALAGIHFVPQSQERCDKLYVVEILLGEYFADDFKCISAACLPLSIWNLSGGCHTSRN